MGSLDSFSPATRAWFERSFEAPTAAQEAGWKAISGGSHTLIHAPTGSGKTLAAFLWAIDTLFADELPDRQDRCRVLYVSPLKALAYDIERNLRSPLIGIGNEMAARGDEVPDLLTAMRTGDTPQTERRRMLRRPPDILITTPESLYLMLTSSAREILRPVRAVIVDEIHSVASTKRGSHLALSLERLEEVTTARAQRIGLSATQRPLERIAEFLGGGEPDKGSWRARPVEIVDAPRDKKLEVDIVVPVEDMTRPEAVDEDGNPTKSIWTSVYPEILRLVGEHRSTIVFANNRGLVERLARALNEQAGEEIARAHHGSVSREQRVEIEDALKAGELRCVVATSSLELGIDMDAVDLVVLVESPTTVARGLQRVGRSGHQVGAPSKATVFPKHRGDLLEATVVVDRMVDGQIEETHIPRHPLDVLAQQLVAMVAIGDREVEAVFDLVRRAEPYRALGRGAFESVLDMLSGKYPSDDFAELSPRLTWDRVGGTLTARPSARILAVTNAGTIPDRGLYPVVLPEGGRVGELDEEMVYESRVGDTFVLGSSTWRMVEITPDRVVATPEPGRHGARLPFWHGDALGRPVETGIAIGTFTREIGALDPEDARAVLESRYRLQPDAAGNLIAYLREEREATGALPSDRTIVIQRYRDEIGDWRLVMLSPYGARVHAPWSLAIRRRLRDQMGAEADAVWSDDGVIVRFPDSDLPPEPEALVIDPDDVERLVTDEVATSALFAGRFREAAARSLLLPRRRPGKRTPLWLQRRRSTSLLEAASRYPAFPVVLESYREVLQEHFDLPALRSVLDEVRSRRIRVHPVDTPGPSPFATSLSFDFVASFMYDYDAPPAERRAMALTIDRALLAELLGEPALRDLLEPDVIEAVEAELQALAPGRQVSGPDAVADLLRRLGPLTSAEVAERSTGDGPDELLEALEADRRAIRIAGPRGPAWAAIEDAARLRDGLGAALPQGIPEALLEPVDDPLGDLVGRYARTHGPFSVAQAATDLGLPPGAVLTSLQALEHRGRVTEGGFLPGSSGREWVDVTVLQRLRRRSLAVLRRQIEAVDQTAFARFTTSWHDLGGRGRSEARFTDALARLQGASIPASILEAEVLPARLDYSPGMLDTAAAAGELIWIGRGALGNRDGRVSLYRRDQASLLHWGEPEPVEGAAAARIIELLGERGASFFPDLYAAAGGGDPAAVVATIWDLAWAGWITNDTLAPLRALLGSRPRARAQARPRVASATPPAATGRWYLVSDAVSAAPETPAAAARTNQLLERHGLLVRDAALNEGVPGGFAGLRPVLSALEDAGKVRRGYFVEGLGGSQYALPGAVDRLRAGGDDEGPPTLLAAADPANPYGATLAWPDSSGRPSRSAGAKVVLVGGRLVAFVERGGSSVLTFSDDSGHLEAAASALAPPHGGRRRAIRRIDDAPAADTPLGRLLLDRGFVESYRGITAPG